MRGDLKFLRISTHQGSAEFSENFFESICEIQLIYLELNSLKIVPFFTHIASMLGVNQQHIYVGALAIYVAAAQMYMWLQHQYVAAALEKDKNI